jgi:hypothetical protein
MSPNAQNFCFTFFKNSKIAKFSNFITAVHSRCRGSEMYVITSRRYLQLSSVERYDILERYDVLERYDIRQSYFDISDNIQGKFYNVSCEVATL